jgi:hypothetical protein
MRMRIISAWVGSLAILGPGLATTARAQGQVDERPKLRAAIVKLRAEVEMLQLEQEAAVSVLKPMLVDLRNEDSEFVGEGVTRLVSNMKAQAVLPEMAVAGFQKQMDEFRKGLDIEKDLREALRPFVERKKKEFLLRTVELNEKRLDLEDMERQYRETWQAPRPGDGAKRASFERAEPRPAVLTSAQRLDVCLEPPDTPLTPILDPVPGGSAPCCLDPPTEAEVWAKAEVPPLSTAGLPPGTKVERRNIRFEIEKIGEQVDPVKVYPLAGPCQLVHCHYKCTVRYEEVVGNGEPKPGAVIVNIDKDHLRRAAVAETPPRAAQAVVDIERRMDEMDRKLDRILKALGDPGRGPRD